MFGAYFQRGHCPVGVWFVVFCGVFCLLFPEMIGRANEVTLPAGVKAIEEHLYLLNQLGTMKLWFEQLIRSPQEN